MCLVKCFWFPVIYPEKFAVSGRSRLDKSAEVSACKRHMPDTCAFVSTRCKSFLGQLLESRKDHNRILDTSITTIFKRAPPDIK